MVDNSKITRTRHIDVINQRNYLERAPPTLPRANTAVRLSAEKCHRQCSRQADEVSLSGGSQTASEEAVDSTTGKTDDYSLVRRPEPSRTHTDRHHKHINPSKAIFYRETPIS